MITVALIGNPNAGKTSLLNSLTGQSLHVGNWSGKTIEKREGFVVYAGEKIKIVDLPGTYSIAPYSEEEAVAHDYISGQDFDIILQIIDVNTLERSLLLTMELLATGKKVILAFNFNHEAMKRGMVMDFEGIGKKLEVPIVRIEADTEKVNTELLEKIIDVSKNETIIPSYVEGLRKSECEIRHPVSLDFIEKNIKPLFIYDKKISISDRLDSFLLHKFFSWPIFLGIILLMFNVIFLLSSPITKEINFLLNRLGEMIYALELPNILLSFLVEGLLGGLGTVITFVPLIFLLFLFIAIFEDSGYLSRTVILFDRLYRFFGISGKSFIPMILGFGCNVPAILATRTIKNRKERLIAIFVAPFMSCSARLPVFILFAGIFFPNHSTLIIIFLYFFGVLVSLLVSLVLSKLMKSTEENTLIVELPPYRRPGVANVLKHAWSQSVSYVKRIGTIILVFVILTWALASLPLGVYYASEASVLGGIGQTIAPVFKPLGFGSWQFAVALLSGFIAKENTIGALATIFHGSQYATFDGLLKNNLSFPGALAFLVFVLLYVPCLATMIAMKKETSSNRFVIGQILTSLGIAWVLAFFTFRVGVLLL